MGEFLVVEEDAGFLEFVDDELVGVPDGFAAEEFGDGVVVAAVGEDGVVGFEVVFLAGGVVFLAVAGGGVDEAGAVFECDVVGEDDGLAGGWAVRGWRYNTGQLSRHQFYACV